MLIGSSFNPTSQVLLQIYNLLGQVVKRLVEGNQPAGRYSVTWDGRDKWGQEGPAVFISTA
ncbi:MAG: FlgD immunoglobulin-like domain containing protein [bacterium]